MNDENTDKVERLRKSLEVSPAERLRKQLVSYNPEITQDKTRSPSRRFIKFVVIPVLVLVIAFGVYKIIEEEKVSKVQQATERETLSKLAARYNAVTDWKPNLEPPNEFYVADVQENYNVLLRRDWLHANQCVPSGPPPSPTRL